ncbi:hypothetical protein FGO68_gene11163 [Halteria grandinella]|uniref:Transmembrane protein n=1 Tax=Halteria grandinella TaxID=5974 RepID=A0A8J8NQY4_HALGN|nr:hypothetical protein FGO68_gene11163 [Halteria grandinella]
MTFSCVRFLEKYSFGFYQPPLYYRGNARYGSKTSIVLTLLFVLFMIIGTINIILSIFKREHFNLKQKEVDLLDVPQLVNMSLYEGIKMLDPIFSISILCQQEADCAKYQLAVSQEAIPNLNIDEQFITSDQFNILAKLGKYCECQLHLMSMQSYVDYLNTNASEYPAVQLNENFDLIQLTNYFNLYTKEKRLELQGQRISFSSVQLMEGGKIVDKALLKQAIHQNGKILPDQESSFVWTMNLAQFNATTGILSKAFEFAGIGDVYRRQTYIDLDDIEYYEYSGLSEEHDEWCYDMYHFFFFNRRIIQTEMAPDSIFSGLSQIGGLTGLAMIFKFLAAYQERNFEKNITKTQGGKVGLKSNLLKISRIKADHSFWNRITQIRRPTAINDETQESILEDIEEGHVEAVQQSLEVKQFFSIEMFKSMHDNIVEMKEKIIAQEKMIMMLQTNKDF